MSASIIPPLPDPPLFYHLASTVRFSLSLRASSRFSATGGWFQTPSVVQRVSIPLSIFPVFFPRPPSYVHRKLSPRGAHGAHRSVIFKPFAL